MNWAFLPPVSPATGRPARTFWLLAGLLAVAAPGGCRRDPAPIDAEQTALKVLEVYVPRTMVDEEGHVINLKLEGPQVDDAAMEQVPHFTRLKSLSLAFAPVTDAGLAKVQELKRLEALGLVGTRVTDRGLSMLQKVVSLRQVWVRSNDRLTLAGIEALMRALPGISVYECKEGRADYEVERPKGRF
jgi:hypothetical protein